MPCPACLIWICDFDLKKHKNVCPCRKSGFNISVNEANKLKINPNVYSTETPTDFIKQDENKLVPGGDDDLQADIPDEQDNLQQADSHEPKEDFLQADMRDQHDDSPQDDMLDQYDNLMQAKMPHNLLQADMASQAANEDRQGQPQTVVNHGEERTGKKVAILD